MSGDVILGSESDYKEYAALLQQFDSDIDDNN